MDRLKAAKRFADRMLLGTPALGFALQLYGEDCMEWDPALIAEAIRKDAEGHLPSWEALHRLQAMIEVHNSTAFFEDPLVFHAVTSTLYDPEEDPSSMVLAPSPLELSWSCTEIQIALGPSYSLELYKPDVRRYCGTALMQAGLPVPTVGLQFADFPPSRFLGGSDSLGDLEQEIVNDEQTEVLERVREKVGVAVRLLDYQLRELAEFGADTKVLDNLKAFVLGMKGTEEARPTNPLSL